MTESSNTTGVAATPEHDYPRTDLTSVRMFPARYLVDPGTPPSDVEQMPPFSLEGRIEFLKRLERELEAAWRAGHEYLSIPRRQPDGDPYPGMTVAAQFVPHDEPDKFTGMFHEHSVTYAVQDIAAGSDYYRHGDSPDDDTREGTNPSNPGL